MLNDGGHLSCKIEQILPAAAAQPAAQAGLLLFPDRQGARQEGFSRLSQAPEMPAPIFAGAAGDPAMAAHDFESAGERGDIESEHPGQAALREFTCGGEHLENGELGGAEAERAERFFVKLG